MPSLTKSLQPSLVGSRAGESRPAMGMALGVRALARATGAGLVLACVFTSAGCLERGLEPVNPCTRSRVGERISVDTIEDVDLLFAIDNSGSMADEQVALAREIPRMVRVLVSGDRDLDGVVDFTPVRSLHVGVVTSDMGTGGFNAPTCGAGAMGFMFGDDGVMRSSGRAELPGCMASYPSPVFDFARDRDDPMAFAAEVACVATVGTGGCGFEQQLDSALKALSPVAAQPWTRASYEPVTFFGSTFGHGDGVNDGFVRADSALAIVMMSDEEDCSVTNPDLFNPSSPTYGGTDLNLRCFTYPEVLHPVERYVRGFAQLRERANLLVFAGIVGVPIDAVGTSYAAMLDHPLMREEIDPAMPTRLRPSCNTASGIAFPPRRIVRVAQGLEAAGASTTIQSICQDSFGGALDDIIDKIASALSGACLPRELNTDAEGLVECEVLEVLPGRGDVTSCAGLPGRTPAGTEIIAGVERSVCSVAQVGPARRDEPGWYYETIELAIADSDLSRTCGPAGRRIRFTIDSVTHSEIRLECLQTVRPGGGDMGLGAFCSPDRGAPACGAIVETRTALGCDPFVRECQVPCATTADCSRSGLLGYVCDTRAASLVVGEGALPIVDGAPLAPDAPHAFCVNPTCL